MTQAQIAQKQALLAAAKKQAEKKAEKAATSRWEQFSLWTKVAALPHFLFPADSRMLLQDARYVIDTITFFAKNFL